MNLENKKILIHVLTPMSIGSGEEFSPLTFWMDEVNNELVEFTEDALVDRLSSQDKNDLWNGDLRQCMKLIARVCPAGKMRVSVSPEIVKKYKNILSGAQKELNSFSIQKIITEPNSHLPYIPGSALKGALRTGYLSSCPNLAKNEGKINEDAILGKMSMDIFSTLKIGDCIPVGHISTQIIYALRCHKKPQMSPKPKSPISTMVQAVMGGTVFAGEITLSPTSRTRTSFKNITEILEKIDKYSFSLLKDKQIGIKYPAEEDLRRIKQEFANPVYLCRLGKFIGAESHSFANLRSIKIRKSKKTYDFRPYSTCAVLASATSKVPTNISFGWCLIEVLDGPASQPLTALQNLTTNQKESLGINSLFSKIGEELLQNLTAAQKRASKKHYSATSIYLAKVKEFSKKGRALVQVMGEESVFTLMEEGKFEVGQELEITQIQGTTCKLKK